MKKPNKLDEFRATALQMTKRGDVPADVTALMQAMLADLAQQTQRADLNAKLSASHLRRARKFESEARTDPLTELPNRRGIEEVFVQRVGGSARNDKQYHTIIMCDVDKFKPINDTYGHDVGDLLIKHIGKILEPARLDQPMGQHHLLRPADVAGRFGGDEFVIILSEVGVSRAGKLIEVLQDRIKQEQPFTFTDKKTGAEVTRPVLISMGFSTFSTPNKDKVFAKFMQKKGLPVETVSIKDYMNFHLKRADKRLYRNKKMRKKAESDAVAASKQRRGLAVTKKPGSPGGSSPA